MKENEIQLKNNEIQLKNNGIKLKNNEINSMNYKISDIKAIFFDAGYTLNAPRTGHWFITPNFYSILEKYNSYFTCTEVQLQDAFQKADSHIGKVAFVKTVDQEFQMFKEFYRIVLEEISYPVINTEIVELLAEDNVFNDEKFLFFDDVEPNLMELKDKYMLGIISDTWPSLERVFINRNLNQYFSSFVMSSIYGSTKSTNLLFKIACEELNIKPQEAIFIDDLESNLRVAEEYGMNSILIDRYNQKELSIYPLIHSLDDLHKILF